MSPTLTQAQKTQATQQQIHVMPQRPAIIIPAHNEAHNLPRAIQQIREAMRKITPAGTEWPIIVVDDDSIDETAQIAEQYNCVVVKIKAKKNIYFDTPESRNVGKANVFFAGIKEALKRKATSAVLLDADLLIINPHDLDQLVQFAEYGTKNKKTLMCVGKAYEKSSQTPQLLSYERATTVTNISGTRSFSLQALIALNRARTKGFVRGYGLENYLNVFFKKHEIDKIDTLVLYGPPFRNYKLHQRQIRDEKQIDAISTKIRNGEFKGYRVTVKTINRKKRFIRNLLKDRKRRARQQKHP
jgi:glycosyltransferase involved in cell wall biosynthesis